MERSTGRWFFLGWCVLAAVGVSSASAEAGKIVQCTDAEGRVSFSDVGCPPDHNADGIVGNTKYRDTSAQGSYRVRRSAAEPGYEAPAGYRNAPYAEDSRGDSAVESGYSVMDQADRMEARRERVKQRQAEEYQRWKANQGPGYWDEVAARNAMVRIESERETPTGHYKPKNAAEMAIEYNTRSVAGGGRHQVRVPDVYENHVHSAPVLTYEQARQKALEATGYRSYGNLTRSQRETVDAEMAMYNYLPRESSGWGDQVNVENENNRALEAEKQRKQKIDEVERDYRREARWQEIGVLGRDKRFDDAVKDCKRTPGAICK